MIGLKKTEEGEEEEEVEGEGKERRISKGRKGNGKEEGEPLE